MRRYQSLGDLPLGGPRRVVAIGTFDGVHLGHQAVIRGAIEIAAERRLPAMALTFEPQPIAVLRPELRPAVLTPIGLKSQLIERLGVDELLVVPFTKAFSRIRAERFAEMLASAPVKTRASSTPKSAKRAMPKPAANKPSRIASAIRPRRPRVRVRPGRGLCAFGERRRFAPRVGERRR